MSGPATSPTFPSLLQSFFCQRLINQRNVSSQTVASYRDTFRLFLRYAQERTRKPPVALTIADLDAPLILSFLEYLQKERGNCARTRNLRLVALRSFLHYAAHLDPAALPTIQRVLAIPMKRFDRPLLGFLSTEEIQAIIAAPDRSTWNGKRDHVLLTTLYNTGARVSEIIGMRVADVEVSGSPSVHIRGKGRKERSTPLWRGTAKLLTSWMGLLNGNADVPVFPNRAGRPMTRSGVEQRLRTAVAIARQHCPSLENRRISPHIVRHTTAMHLLQSGVDITVIALWLGHESPETTHRYVEADLSMKEKALAVLEEPPDRFRRFRPDDRLLSFLDSL